MRCFIPTSGFVFAREPQHHAMYIDGRGVPVLHLGREFKLILIHCYLDLPTAVSKIITWQGTLENTFIFRILSNFLVRCPDASTCRKSGRETTQTVQSTHPLYGLNRNSIPAFPIFQISTLIFNPFKARIPSVLLYCFCTYENDRVCEAR